MGLKGGVNTYAKSFSELALICWACACVSQYESGHLNSIFSLPHKSFRLPKKHHECKRKSGRKSTHLIAKYNFHSKLS
jgi:hypothetical protein